MGFFKRFSDNLKANKTKKRAEWLKNHPNGLEDSYYDKTNDPYYDDDDPNEDLYCGDLNHVDLNHNGIPDIEEEEPEQEYTFGGWNGWDDDDDDD